MKHVFSLLDYVIFPCSAKNWVVARTGCVGLFCIHKPPPRHRQNTSPPRFFLAKTTSQRWAVWWESGKDSTVAININIDTNIDTDTDTDVDIDTDTNIDAGVGVGVGVREGDVFCLPLIQTC